MDITEEKKELRRRMKQLAGDITPAGKAQQAAEVFTRVEAMEEFRRARTVGLYWSLPDELPTHDVAVRWAEAGKHVCLPVVVCGELEFRRFTPGCEMVEGSLCVCEPVSGEVIAPEDMDLIIVPGVAFDWEGFRLGRGKGYYDKFLGRTAAYSVGVCMRHQLVENVPRELHDRPVDRIIG